MRPVCLYADLPTDTRAQIMGLLHGRWRTATRLAIVVLSAAGLSPAQIAEMFDYDPATVRRWLHRFSAEGTAGLPDRARCGRPPLGPSSLPGRIAALLDTPGPWTIARLWRHLGRPEMSMRTLWRRTRQVAAWHRPRLIAKDDPDHDRTVAGIRRRLAALPAGSVVLAEDEKHLNLLPTLRASWIPHHRRHQVMTPGTNRRVSIFGALNLAEGTWWHLFARHSAAGFIAVLQMLLDAYPHAPRVVLICDNDASHHARAVQRFAAEHSRLRLIYSARYSPQDNPVERIWAALLAHTANTAVSLPERVHQARVFFRQRSPQQMLATAAPWSSPWLPPSWAHKSYAQNFGQPA